MASPPSESDVVDRLPRVVAHLTARFPLLDPHDRVSAAHDAVVSVLRDPPPAGMNWYTALIGRAHNRAFDLTRRRTRRTRTFGPWHAGIDTQAGWGDPAVELADREDRNQTSLAVAEMGAVVGRLPDTQRRAVLKWLGGMGGGEIAAEEGVTRAVVWSRIQKAKDFLRVHLAHLDDAAEVAAV